MSTTLTIAKREFRSNFDSPLAYVVICFGLIALGVIFFFMNGGFWQADRASLAQLFMWAPIGLSFLIIPVITMRLLAEEKRSGTLEMLITLPVQDHEVVLGKFLGAWGLVLVLVFSTVLYPILMFSWPWHLGALDTGPVVSGYIGLVLYSAAAVSIGLLISSLTDSQVIAFFITFLLLGFLHGVDNFADYAPSFIRDVLSFISFDTRLAPFARGMVSTRDIVFFLSITAGCLMAAFRALERRKWA
ncbi:ABC transporter permease [Sorangium sp. So ce1099]|uniref:ABC transporter permease n=1 Tax=Sorangium sp. So ce1099 TaxID=3133331 RepID=UPI003F5F58F4